MDQVMASTGAQRHRNLALLALLGLAAALRLHGLSRQSLWLDEINQLLTSAHPLSELEAQIRWHASPPLDYLIMHFWQFLGWSELIVRLPAAIWSVTSVGLLYHAARKLGHENAALSAGVLMALSLPSIAYAQEARMYSLFVFGATALLCAAARLLRDPAANSAWAAIGLAAVLVMYTHYYAALLLVSLAVSLLFVCVARRSLSILGKAIAAGTAVVLAFVPWLPTLVAQFRLHEGGVQYALPTELYFETMLPYLSGGLEGTWVWVICGAFVLGLVLEMWRSPEKGMILAAFSILPFLLAYSVPPFSDAVTPRNLLFLLPGFYLGIAIGLTAPTSYVVRRLRRLRKQHSGGTAAAQRPSSPVAAAHPSGDAQFPISGTNANVVERTPMQALASLAVVLVVVVWPTSDMLSAYYERGWWMKGDNTDWRETASYLETHIEPGDVIVTDDRYTRYLLSFYLDPDAVRGFSLDPYVQNASHTLPRNNEKYRVLTAEAPVALFRSVVRDARTLWSVNPTPALERLFGISAASREEIDAGFDVPVVRIAGPRLTDALVLSHPVDEPSLSKDTGSLNLVTWEGWSSQFHLQDGVLVRRMGPRGLLRLPRWSARGSVVRLRLFAPPEFAGGSLGFRAGDVELAAWSLTAGWQDVSVLLDRAPAGDGWVMLQLDVAAVDPAQGEDRWIGNTGLAAPVPIVAESGTHEASRFADIYVDGVLYSWFAAARGYARGYNLVAIDPESGEVVDWAVFDTHGDPAADAAMASFINGMPNGTIVAGAVKDDGATRLSEAGYRALAELGCSVDIRGRFRAAHAFVGVKGAARGTAIEDALGLHARVVVGRDARDLTIGLASVEVTVTR